MLFWCHDTVKYISTKKVKVKIQKIHKERAVKNVDAVYTMVVYSKDHNAITLLLQC